MNIPGIDSAVLAYNAARQGRITQYMDLCVEQTYSNKVLAAQGLCSPCQKGCSACCYESVYCDEREAMAGLALIPETKAEQVRAATREWVQKATESELLAKVEPEVLWWRLNRLACPFLEKSDGTCMVYEVRPIACQTHLSVGPREFCDNDKDRMRAKYVSMLAPQSNAFKILWGALDHPVSMNHLGIHLAKLVLGIDVPNKSSMNVSFTAASKPVAEKVLDVDELSPAPKALPPPPRVTKMSDMSPPD